MSQGDVISIMQDAIYTVLLLSAPLLIGGLLVGLIVSIFQATTQINEQTLSFVPKLIAILLVLLVTFSWMMTNLDEFVHRLFSFMAAL